MANRSDDKRARPELSDPSIGGVVDLVKTYAKQETIEPIKGAGKFLGFGIGGALLTALGGSLVLLGLLRLFQTEIERTASGSLSWLAYVMVLVVCLAFLALAYLRIVKPGSDRPANSREKH
ncbi:hypothetical protein [Desertimonas flava]|uniref:hypothetical protein n=1 Tax=Desertimonas flava TaxID=2064846 RepID=UPI000E3528CA|nr:hypothetical protein [Desertimonas flava]